MKKIFRPLIKGTNWALAGILTMLGFSGCEFYGPVEYGSPSANYTVKGKVVNKADGKAIKGIRIGYESATNSSFYLEGTVSDENGEFKLTDQDIYKNKIPVYFDDIDGELNGSFASDTVEIDFSKVYPVGKKGWYEGEYIVTTTVELTPE